MRHLAIVSFIFFTVIGCRPDNDEPAPTCTYAGAGYAANETFGAIDGCNTCWCEASGAVACTRIACPIETCDYAGETYDQGESFPATDGCNTCMCGDDGLVGCTKIGCVCNPANEFQREYVGTSPEMCQVIRFTCPENTTYFSNDCGCGCEQAETCPEYFNCMPGPGVVPCDVNALSAQCPYSEFAY